MSDPAADRPAQPQQPPTAPASVQQVPDTDTPPAEGQVLPYYTPAQVTRGMVNLARMSPMEAELARIKLEGEGVPCFVADANTANVYNLTLPDATLLVHETDVQRAREILDRPAEPPAGDDEDYVDEPWRCPQCHRKAVELRPIAPGLRRVRWAWCAMVGLSLLLGIAKSVDRSIENLVSQAPDGLAVAWVLLLVAGGLYAWVRGRGKRCTHCGHQW